VPKRKASRKRGLSPIDVALLVGRQGLAQSRWTGAPIVPFRALPTIEGYTTNNRNWASAINNFVRALVNLPMYMWRPAIQKGVIYANARTPHIMLHEQVHSLLGPQMKDIPVSTMMSLATPAMRERLLSAYAEPLLGFIPVPGKSLLTSDEVLATATQSRPDTVERMLEVVKEHVPKEDLLKFVDMFNAYYGAQGRERLLLDRSKYE